MVDVATAQFKRDAAAVSPCWCFLCEEAERAKMQKLESRLIEMEISRFEFDEPHFELGTLSSLTDTIPLQYLARNCRAANLWRNAYLISDSLGLVCRSPSSMMASSLAADGTTLGSPSYMYGRECRTLHITSYIIRRMSLPYALSSGKTGGSAVL